MKKIRLNCVRLSKNFTFVTKRHSCYRMLLWNYHLTFANILIKYRPQLNICYLHVGQTTDRLYFPYSLRWQASPTPQGCGDLFYKQIAAAFS